MQFTRLRLSGFKSFVQPAELLIEPGLTGVVGPNGCGKSNLVEALRWAMGESSARGLRGGEMDDVIFAGTSARPAYDLAEVVLHLRGAGLEVPGLGAVEEIELCRRIGRGMGSSFRLNGSELRARDVQLLFADAASGARSASIVSQGQIGALVEAKPAERRRILEDAAGIGGLQARRHEAELKLQAAETNLERVQDLLATLAEQHERLRKQARQAARYRELSATHREVEATLLAGRWQAARAQHAEAEAALEEARARVARSTQAVANRRRERDDDAANLQRLRSKEASLGADLARLGERRQAAAKEVAQFEARRRALIEREAQAGQDQAHAEAALADAATTLERCRDERSAVLEQSQRRGDELERAAAEAGAVGAAAEAADACYREALSTLADLEARHKQLHAREEQAARARAALDVAEQQARDEQARLGEQPAGASAGEAAAESEADLQAALAAAEQAEAELRLAEEQCETSRQALAEAERRCHELREQRHEHEARRRGLAEERRRLIERREEVAARRERLQTRSAHLASRVAERRARREKLDLPGKEAVLAGANAGLEQAGATLAEARERHASVQEELERAEREVDAVRLECERLASEANALTELFEPDTNFARIVDDITVADGYADALGAAMGDDLLASLDEGAHSHWRRIDAAASAPEAPGLPAGLQPLAVFVEAPSVLARRLAQIGVAEPDQAQALQGDLAPGQRLVSREGGLWRWDGFVRRPDGSRSAAARLRQRARWQALQRQLASRRGDLDARRAALEEEIAAERAAASGLEEAQNICTAREAVRDAARLELSEARSADAALAAELDALADQAATLEAEQSELGAADEGLEREYEALERAGAGAGPSPELERDLIEAETARAASEASDREAQMARVEARESATDARRGAATAQVELEQRHAAMRAAANAMQERARRQARLEAELARLETERGTLEQSRRRIEAERAKTAAELATARARLAEAEAGLALRRARHSEATSQGTRLRDRQAADEARLAALDQEIELWRERVEAGQARLEDLGSRRAALQAELTGLGQAPGDLARQEDALQAELAQADERRRDLEQERAAAERELGELEARLERAEAERLAAREAAARLEAQLERARSEAVAAEAVWRERAPSGPVEIPSDPPAAEELAALEEKLARLSASRERLGPVNLRAVDEAAELETQLQTLQDERDELMGAIERLRRAIGSLNREGRERLRAAFGQIEHHFEALFSRLFGGGQARLALTDMDDPLAAGLELAASPPGKKLQSLSLLSGGEKALTALALMFAVFLTRPSPLCVLDEVDAPLDDANVERLAGLLEELAENTRTRFVVITHHPLTMSRMDRLYGVTMLERGVSQLVSVDLGGAMALRATA